MGVADHSKSTYLELQRKKVHRYVIFKIDEKKKRLWLKRLEVRLRAMMILLHLRRRVIVDMQSMTLIL